MTNNTSITNNNNEKNDVGYGLCRILALSNPFSLEINYV